MQVTNEHPTVLLTPENFVGSSHCFDFVHESVHHHFRQRRKGLHRFLASEADTLQSLRELRRYSTVKSFDRFWDLEDCWQSTMNHHPMRRSHPRGICVDWRKNDDFVV
jgi:hypothetical protein